MYKVQKIGMVLHAIECDCEEDTEDIEEAVDEGAIIIFCKDIDDLRAIGIDTSFIEVLD